MFRKLFKIGKMYGGIDVDSITTTKEEQQDIVPAHLAVKSLRDSGYKNTAYATAELIDNSIQAGASSVELIGAEKEELVNKRKSARVKQVAVLDNGHGMSKEVLHIALQFGNGTHLDETEDQLGIGKFGIGLPNSSISQCRRVDVWSWQNGPENAIHTYLDIDEILKKEQVTIPIPEEKPIPDKWWEVGNTFEETGTIVVWSKLDRCLWKKATTIMDHSELIIGRTYRRFLNKDKVSIKLVSFDLQEPENTLNEDWVRPNDPIYLMKETSCPEPFDDKSMFEKFGDKEFERVFNISPLGFDEEFEVTVRLTLAKDEARAGHNPGSKPHGQHAKNNVGVSIIRADRELDLDRSWVNPSDPRERWWGVEVEFPPALDDLFGVTNNKQSARNFTEMAKINIDDYKASEDETFDEMKRRMKEEGDPQGHLIEIASFIKERLNRLRRLLRAQTAGKRERYSEDDKKENSPEAKGTEATKKRQKKGRKGLSDEKESGPDEKRKRDIQNTLKNQGMAESIAEEIADDVVTLDFKYAFHESELQSASFFNVKPSGGSLIITLNVGHPAYDQLVQAVEDVDGEASKEDLRARLREARDGLRLLLEAWARFEDEQPEGERRNFAQDARNDWGRIAREFFGTEN